MPKHDVWLDTCGDAVSSVRCSPAMLISPATNSESLSQTVSSACAMRHPACELVRTHMAPFMRPRNAHEEIHASQPSAPASECQAPLSTAACRFRTARPGSASRRCETPGSATSTTVMTAAAPFGDGNVSRLRYCAGWLLDDCSPVGPLQHARWNAASRAQRLSALAAEHLLDTSDGLGRG